MECLSFLIIKKFHLKLWFNQGFHPIFTTCDCLTKQQNYSARFAFKVPLVQFYLLQYCLRCVCIFFLEVQRIFVLLSTWLLSTE